ncbi:kinetochore complex Sim4 subunit Fta1-domain-containing protein [Xylariaceae sp. FL0255]|nr:kinetochore complex Sim4 subunit Fta1-domain-containing protein [Xylariaceae sp. FL0255]
MAPRKRIRANTSQAKSVPEPRDDDGSNHSDQDNDDHSSDPEGGEATLRFYNTTFSTFRVSPLYVGKEPLSTARLETLSRRLRDTLVGDVVRGVQVALEPSDGTLGRTGALEKVEWRWRSVQSLLAIPSRKASSDQDNRAQRKKRALCLRLIYENVSFSALLLPSLDDATDDNDVGDNGPSWTWGNANTNQKDGDDDGSLGKKAFIHLPLLLTRMPTPLKSVITEFLSTNFDCRVSPLHIGTRTLIRSWERWVANVGHRSLTKDVALTLGFHIEQPADMANKGSQNASGANELPQGLRSIDVVIPADEVRRFLRAGNTRKRPAEGNEAEGFKQRERRRKLAGGRDEEGWAWRYDGTDGQPQQEGEVETIKQPFTEALARYLQQHLALDMFHPGVRVLRVTCDAFALSEGRVKVFAPSAKHLNPVISGDGDDNDDGAAGGGGAAVETFVRDLVRRAQGREWSSQALRLADLGL